MRPTNKSPVLAIVAIMAIVVGLPMVYVVSIGPANALHTRSDPQTQQFIEGVYAPLIWLEGNSETCSRILVWYCDLWD